MVITQIPRRSKKAARSKVSAETKAEPVAEPTGEAVEDAEAAQADAIDDSVAADDAATSASATLYDDDDSAAIHNTRYARNQSDDDDDDAEDIDPSELVEDAAFGSTLQSLLTEPVVASATESLLNNRKRSVGFKAEEKAISEQRKLKHRRLSKKLLRNSFHNDQPEQSLAERRYIKIATKGVVTLFNAISKQQKEYQQSEEAATQSRSKQTVSERLKSKQPVATKDSFLQLLRDTQAVKREADKPSAATAATVKSEDDEENDDDMSDEDDDDVVPTGGFRVTSDASGSITTKAVKPKKSGWSVLSDSYMQDKHAGMQFSDQSSDEEDVELQAGAGSDGSDDD